LPVLGAGLAVCLSYWPICRLPGHIGGLGALADRISVLRAVMLWLRRRAELAPAQVVNYVGLLETKRATDPKGPDLADLQQAVHRHLRDPKHRRHFRHGHHVYDMTAGGLG
jgi:hypothetical protein